MKDRWGNLARTLLGNATAILYIPFAPVRLFVLAGVRLGLGTLPTPYDSFFFFQYY